MTSRLQALLKTSESDHDPAARDAAWAELTAVLRGYVRALMARDGRGAQESMDVVQSVMDSFVTELRDRRISFTAEERLRAYLFRAVRHKLTDHDRHRRALRRGGGKVGPLDESGPEPPSLGATASQQVRADDLEERLLAGLDEEQRTLWRLYRAQATWAEIGEKLGIGAEAARLRVIRLRRRLGDGLDGNE